MRKWAIGLLCWPKHLYKHDTKMIDSCTMSANNMSIFEDELDLAFQIVQVCGCPASSMVIIQLYPSIIRDDLILMYVYMHQLVQTMIL